MQLHEGAPNPRREGVARGKSIRDLARRGVAAESSALHSWCEGGRGGNLFRLLETAKGRAEKKNSDVSTAQGS